MPGRLTIVAINTKVKRFINRWILRKLPQPLSIGIFKMYHMITDRENKAIKERIKSLRIDDYVEIVEKPQKNVLIITVDCLRYRNLSFTGYPRETTPFLDGLKFKYQGISTAPWTYPSVASILTGLYPHNHGAFIDKRIKNREDLRRFKAIKQTVITLPELMNLLGYKTYFATPIGLAGFAFKKRTVVKFHPPEYKAESVLKEFLEWVDKNNHRRFFAYIHLGDTHQPLNPPDQYRNYFGKVKKIPNIESWDYNRPEDWEKPGFKEFKDNRMLLYDNTIRYVNDQIEWLFEEFEKRKLSDDTLIVITADHGEEFWEHAKIEAKYFYDPRGIYGVDHGHSVFSELIEVPILFYGFDELKQRDVISSVDIFPTILYELNLKPNIYLDGYPLQIAPKKRLILTEAVDYGYEKKSLIIGEFKLLHAPKDGVKWIFTRKNDPFEQNPILEKEVVQVFEDKLKKILAKGNIEQSAHR